MINLQYEGKFYQKQNQKSFKQKQFQDNATLNNFHNHYRLAIQMLSSEPEIDEYYGYNSIINDEGKRVRRLRRTEASAEKLITSRMRSPANSRSISARRSKAQQNRSNCISGSPNRSNSNFKVRCANNISKNFYKQSSQPQSDYEHFQKITNKLRLQRLQKTERPLKNVNQMMGQYYLGNTSQKQQTIQQSKDKKQSEFTNKISKGISSKAQNSDYFTECTPKPKIKRLKKTQTAQRKQKHIEVSHLEPKQMIIQSQNKLSKLKQSIESRSKIKLKVSKNNSKVSKISQREKEKCNKLQESSSYMQSQMKDSLISLKNQEIEGNIASSKKASKLYNQYGFAHFDEEEIFQLKNSHLKIKKSPQLSEVSDNFSRISSHADKIKSKIKERKEKSRIQFQTVVQDQSQSKQQIDLKVVKKITTETDASIKSKDVSKHFSGIQHSKLPKNIDLTPKLSKKSLQESMKQKSRIMSNDNSQNKNLGNSSSNPQSHFHYESVTSNEINIINNKSHIESNESKINTILQKEDNIRKISIDSFRNLPLASAGPNQQLKLKQKKSISSYTYNDILQIIQEHQIRLGFIYLFVDNTKNIYESAIKFERYQRLCFLMLKKYLYEKNRIIKSLKGDQNCFNLTDAEIPTEVLKKHLTRQQVKERLTAFTEQGKEIFKQVQQEYYKINRKYPKDKFIKLQSPKDNFSKEIMRLLMEELTKLYQELHSDDIESDLIDSNEQRIIEIVEIMFLISQLEGRQVKKFELLEDNVVDFDEYYSDNYEFIMETAQYFEKYT